MNKQKSKTGRGIEWTDYTWNPIGGCHHNCRWTMPDGSEAICYAEALATHLRTDTFYPDGFAHHYWYPERLKEPGNLNTPSRIFLDSMSDLMGTWVPAEQIEAVLAVCRSAPHHVFQLLTKNAPRLKQFTFPKNVWVGASMPPSSINGKPMTLDQQRKMLRTTLGVLAKIDVPVRWISFEPLSFDPSSCIDLSYELDGNAIQWAVIGAASNGPKTFQPESLAVHNTIAALRRMDARIFFKGNLAGNKAAITWLEEMPVVQ